MQVQEEFAIVLFLCYQESEANGQGQIVGKTLAFNINTLELLQFFFFKQYVY